MNCPLCQHSELREIYHGLVRAGAPGQVSSEKYRVLQCARCKGRHLSPFPQNLEQFYESEAYRDAYNQSHDIAAISAMHLELRRKMVERLNPASLRGKSIADFGCAEGGLLDLIEGAERTIAIEPAQYFHEHLRSRGHQVFSYGRDFVHSGGKADVVMSFSVIEHVQSPAEFLTEMHDALEVGGQLVISTPNTHDILDQLVPEAFRPFNFRTAHLHYFCAESLHALLTGVGFKQIHIGYLHLYDVSNLLGWYKEGKPTGLSRIPFFDEGINAPLRQYLEHTGRASDLWVEAVR